MSSYKRAVSLYDFIESKNSHGKNQLLEKLHQLGLENTTFAEAVKQGPTSLGKNVAKDLWLRSFIHGLR